MKPSTGVAYVGVTEAEDVAKEVLISVLGDHKLPEVQKVVTLLQVCVSSTWWSAVTNLWRAGAASFAGRPQVSSRAKRRGYCSR